MKAIKTNTNITSMTSKQDGSLRLSVVTPELTTKERAAFMDLQGLNLETLFSPLDFKVDDTEVIDKEAGQKSPSQILRNRMFVYYKEKVQGDNFESWYRGRLDKHGQKYLDLLD